MSIFRFQNFHCSVTMSSFPRNFVAKDGQVLTIDFARPDELDEVTEFLRIHFFSTSPNCYLVNDWNDAARSSCLSGYLSSCLRNPVSLTVRDSTGRMVAVRLNELEELGDNQHDILAPEWRRLIVSVLGEMQANFDLFTMFNTKKILSLAMVNLN